MYPFFDYSKYVSSTVPASTLYSYAGANEVFDIQATKEKAKQAV